MIGVTARQATALRKRTYVTVRGAAHAQGGKLSRPRVSTRVHLLTLDRPGGRYARGMRMQVVQAVDVVDWMGVAPNLARSSEAEPTPKGRYTGWQSALCAIVGGPLLADLRRSRCALLQRRPG